VWLCDMAALVTCAPSALRLPNRILSTVSSGFGRPHLAL
jgi:hypothetical protein